MPETAASPAPTRVRYLVLAMLFVATTLNFADRATLSIAGPAAAGQLGLGAVAMGYVFSAFGWAYVFGQIPGGVLLDRFGSKNVYTLSILAWSVVTALQGFVGYFGPAAALISLFSLRLLLGLAESPSFPGNSRIVAAWFPTSERGTASAIFNAAQYFATVVFAPLTGWLTHAYGWQYVFWVMGGLGVLLTLLWVKSIYNPREHPLVNRAELAYIQRGGGLIDMDQPAIAAHTTGPNWSHVKQMLANRMLLGIFLGQYCITTLTYFFLTWFPIYLMQERHLSVLKAGFAVSLPALCGFSGGVLGGLFSDYLLRRGHSLAFARKVPIVAGMLLSVSMIVCNYVHAVWLVVGIMSLAFFGKGIGSLGWAVVSDTAPKDAAGLCGGLFNMFGNTAAITTPTVIGYIVQGTRSFNGALVFVAANAVAAIVCYLFVVGDIQRVELRKEPA
ncbi:MAG: MFS transporter [Bryobacteraceae bacterium]|jgi:ACS family glucarate transporter-like MFS transporter